MSLQGINAYTSNMQYGSIFNNNQKSNSMDLLSNLTAPKSNSDLKDLMDKVDQSRSKSWQKNMMEEYKKFFSSDSKVSEAKTEAKNNEVALSSSSKQLGNAVKDIKTADYSDNAAMQDKVKAFADAYNSTIDRLTKSDSSGALRSGVQMVSATSAYSKSLSSIGINVGKDNKISIDEEKLSNATADDFKALFDGNYSYGNKVADKAGAIDRNAQIKANTIYDRQGRQSFDVSTINSLFSKSF